MKLQENKWIMRNHEPEEEYEETEKPVKPPTRPPHGDD